MNYNECLHYLEQEIGTASSLGLERIKNIMSRLGNPEKSLNIIHVAGTNGKGSAVAMLSSILKESGFKVAAYTSPHLERYNQRFTINGENISDEDLARIITRVKCVCDEIKNDGEELPTLFEIITAAAFLYFSEENVDYAVMEVGLGGRFDATNVIDKPLLSLIMSISLDHTEYLGSTIEAISMEKGGIIKKNCPVVLYSQGKIVYNTIKKITTAVNAPLYCSEKREIAVVSQSLKGTVFSVRTENYTYNDIFLPLLGTHQIENCITVLEACHCLKRQGINISDKALYEGIAHTRWAGRMEIFKDEPLVILDGAHNADGILRLSRDIPKYFSGKEITLLLGILGDKEYKKMTEELIPFVRKIILTEPQNERKLAADVLASTVRDADLPFFVEPDIEKAYDKALSETKKNGAVLCCGSLYMIGALRTYLLSI